MASKQLSSNALAALVAAALIVTIGGAVLSVSGGPAFSFPLTGHQSSNPNASVELTLQQVASLRFAVSTINWGTGAINTTGGNDRCALDTEGGNDPTKCANFTSVNSGFIIENDGTINLTVHIVSNKNRTQFISGNDDINRFAWRISLNGSETGGCSNLTGPVNYTEVNTTSPGTVICNTNNNGLGGMNFLDSNDTIRIDINITIPNDAAIGAKSAIITATGAAV